jgi:hypothetical protein
MPEQAALVLEDIRRLTLQPGDVLVVHMQGGATKQQADDVLLLFQSYFPDHKCLVLAPGLELEVLSEELAPAER